MAFPLAPSTPSSLGFDVRALERLPELITRHLAEGRYPGAQIAVAREGKLALVRSFGDARIESLAGHDILVKQASPSLSFLQNSLKDLAAAADSLRQADAAAGYRRELAALTKSSK